MAVSVAMCTYNGAAYVAEQLASIARQTRAVDEILVCDDCSSDSTADLVRQFAAASPVPVRLEVNPSNLGYRLNFSRAISLCRGDVILLSDQDDIWLPHKVARMMEIFDARPEVDLLFSDAALVSEDLQPLGYTIWESIEFHAERRRTVRDGRFLELLMSRYTVTGATAGFRSRIRDLILPVPGNWVHDAWIALLVAATGTAEYIEEPLILYRQHSAQQLGGRRMSKLERIRFARKMDAQFFLDLARDFEAAGERLRQFRDRIRYPGALELLQGKIDHSRFRAAAKRRRLRSAPRIVTEFLSGRYSRYSLGLISAAQDLLL